MWHQYLKKVPSQTTSSSGGPSEAYWVTYSWNISQIRRLGTDFFFFFDIHCRRSVITCVCQHTICHDTSDFWEKESQAADTTPGMTGVQQGTGRFPPHPTHTPFSKRGRPYSLVSRRGSAKSEDLIQRDPPYPTRWQKHHFLASRSLTRTEPPACPRHSGGSRRSHPGPGRVPLRRSPAEPKAQSAALGPGNRIGRAPSAGWRPGLPCLSPREAQAVRPPTPRCRGRTTQPQRRRRRRRLPRPAAATGPPFSPKSSVKPGPCPRPPPPRPPQPSPLPPEGPAYPQKPQGQRGGRLGALLRSLPASPMAGPGPGRGAAAAAGGGAGEQGGARGFEPGFQAGQLEPGATTGAAAEGRPRQGGRPRPTGQARSEAALSATAPPARRLPWRPRWGGEARPPSRAARPVTQQCAPRCAGTSPPPVLSGMVSPSRRISWEWPVP